MFEGRGKLAKLSPWFDELSIPSEPERGRLSRNGQGDCKDDDGTAGQRASRAVIYGMDVYDGGEIVGATPGILNVLRKTRKSVPLVTFNLTGPGTAHRVTEKPEYRRIIIWCRSG